MALVPTTIGAAAVAMFFIWWIRDAGSDPADWLLGGLLAAALLIAVLVGAGGLPRPLGLSEIAALSGLVGLACWALASISWAEVRADAWTGGNRVLLYAAVFAVFMILRWDVASALAVVTLYVGALGVLAAYCLLRTLSGSTELFISGRLSYPTGYPNANAALFLTGFWVALVLATRRAVPVATRVLAAGTGAAVLQVALLSQSRGSLVALVLTALVVLAAIPGRVRTAVGVGTAVALLAATWHTHTAVFDAALGGGPALESAIRASILAIVASIAVVCAGATIWGLMDQRIEISQAGERRMKRVVVAMTCVGVVAAVVVIAAIEPQRRARVAWDEFRAVTVTSNTEQHFSTGLGSNRYDFWRIAITRFQAHPVAGIGADNFAVPYLERRRSYEEPAYPHSLQIAVLSQLGVIGAVFFAVFFGGSFIAGLPRKSDEPLVGAIAGACLAGAIYFSAHTSADWLWEIPGVAAPVFALLGLAAGVRSSTGIAAREGTLRLNRTGLLLIAPLIAILALTTFGLPWLSLRHTKEALSVWRSQPTLAYGRLERARSLNRLASEPDLIAGTIAARRGDIPRMRSFFTRSLHRDPTNWYAWMELGLTESVAGNRAAALAAIRSAQQLNPREEVVRDVAARISRGERVQPSSLDDLFLDRVASRIR